MEAVVLDLDGTLLNSDKAVSERNLNIIGKLIEREIPIIVATARPPRAIKRMLPEEIKSTAIMVYYNGAMIVSEQLNIKHHFPINSNLSSEIIEYLFETEEKPWLSIEVEDNWYSYDDLDYSTLMKIKRNSKKIELNELKKLNPTKILVSNLNSLNLFIKKFGNRVNIISTDSNQLTQIMKLYISKEFAVKILSEKLGLSLNKMVVFGDDFNDLGLFKLCGYPVAMGNAIPELKDLAKEVTETNDQDGVAKSLEKIFKFENNILL